MDTIVVQYCVLESNRDDHFRVMKINNSGIASVPIISDEIATFHEKEIALKVVAILNALESENGKATSLYDIVKFISEIEI